LQTSKKAHKAQKGASRADFCCYIADSRIEAHRRGWMTTREMRRCADQGLSSPFFISEIPSFRPYAKGRSEQERKWSKP